MKKSVSDGNEPVQLLYSLCQHVLDGCGKKLTNDIYDGQYQYAMRLVGSRFSSSVVGDEFQLVEKIKRTFVRQKRIEDAAIFSELHRKLQSHNTLKGRTHVLKLFQNLNGSQFQDDDAEVSLFSQDPPAFSSTPYVGPTLRTGGLGGHGNVGLSTIHSADSSSGISSYNRSNSISSYLHRSPTRKEANANDEKSSFGRTTKPGDVASMVAKSLILSKQNQDSDNYLIPYAAHSRFMMFQTNNADEAGRFEVTEQSLMRDVLFVFQGIDGTLVKYDPTVDAYRINPKIGVPYPIRDLINRLVELGWLYRKINKYLDNKSGDRALGLVGQSFCAAVRKELGEYYRLLAVLEAQQTQDDSKAESQGTGLTLRRLAVWTHDPLERIRALASLVNVCKGKKGGALLSAIYSHTRVGNPFLNVLIQHMLETVSKPMRTILEKWIYDGELQDQYHEYFIAADPTVRNERLWHEKYSVRKTMLPSFIPPALATKILNIGKSINFIRVVCEDNTEVDERASAASRSTSKAVTQAGLSDSHASFNKSSLTQLIDTVYKHTSKRLLKVMFDNYKLMDHFKAMRRYLLLGQGDFIRHLMDLLEEYLVKPANTLYMHNLTGVLETAIRATNAQYDDADILRRLDCRLLEVSPGDFGWDVFSLDYHVDGPIATIFTPDCMLQYLRIFNFLWRAKRMEYCLTTIWKNQSGNSKILRSLPEIESLLQYSHCLEAEMLHFIHQMQYYIMFEVLETCWDELMRNIEQATDLDHVINAHETFLDHVMTRSLLDAESRLMLTQLRAIFDLIVQFQTAQESMYKAAFAELEACQEFSGKTAARTEKGKWGLDQKDEKSEASRKDTFNRMFIPNTRAQLRVLHQSYQDMLKQFLVMLNGHSDASLRFLCFRLDFNEHYKRREPRLRSPMSIYRSKRYKKPAPAADLKL